MYFTECKSESELHIRYRELSKELHPDVGGSSSDFQEMVAEHDVRLAELNQASAYGVGKPHDNNVGTQLQNAIVEALSSVPMNVACLSGWALIYIRDKVSLATMIAVYTTVTKITAQYAPACKVRLYINGGRTSPSKKSRPVGFAPTGYPFILTGNRILIGMEQEEFDRDYANNPFFGTGGSTRRLRHGVYQNYHVLLYRINKFTIDELLSWSD